MAKWSGISARSSEPILFRLPSKGILIMDPVSLLFCKAKARYIDTNKLQKRKWQKVLIANNHGFDNGQAKTIYIEKNATGNTKYAGRNSAGTRYKEVPDRQKIESILVNMRKELYP